MVFFSKHKVSLNLSEIGIFTREDYMNWSKFYNIIKEKNIDGLKYENSYEGIGYSYMVFSPNQIKLADGTNTTFDSNNNDIRFDNGGSVSELKNYLHNIRLDEYFMENEIMDDDDIEQYKADFGRKGKITYRVYPDKKGDVNSSIYIYSIDRGTFDYGEVQSIEGKKDSRGEGAKAIASLFLLYPNINSVHYLDESYFDNESKSFWQKIGGSSDELLRSNFFNYYKTKFGNNPDIRYDEGGNVKYLKGKKTKIFKILQNNELTRDEADSELWNFNGNYSQLNIFEEGDRADEVEIKALDKEGYFDIDVFEKQISEIILKNKLVDKIELEYGDNEGFNTNWLTLYELKVKYADGGEVKSDYIKRVKEAIKYVENSPNARMQIDFEDEEGSKQAINEGKDYERIFPLKSKSNSFIVKKIREGVQDKYDSIGIWNENKKSDDYKYPKNKKYGDKSKEFDTLQIANYDEKGKIVGIIKIATSENKKQDVKKGAFKISVRQDYQNKGIASKLIEKAESEAIDFVEALKNNNFTSKGRWYFKSWLNKKLKNKVKYKYSEGGMPKKEIFNSIGSAIGFGTIPMIEGHDMVAECDCGEKFTYQNSKKDILWQCPKCNVKKGF